MANRRARHMRNHPTEAESLLRQHLRRSQILGRKFRRQEPIGPYIVDFLCFDPMLVIEIDGSQNTGLIAYDAERSSFLERRGCPPPNPLPSGGGITGHRLNMPFHNYSHALCTCSYFVKQGTKVREWARPASVVA